MQNSHINCTNNFILAQKIIKENKNNYNSFPPILIMLKGRLSALLNAED